MSAVLAVWNDVDADNEAEFNEWYVRQHVPERVGVAGFRNGRRHIALDGQAEPCPRNFTFYEVDDLSVLTSAPYRERLDNPTEWTTRTMPWFANMSRTACRVISRAGHGHGGVAGTLQLKVEDAAQPEFGQWLATDVLPRLVEIPGLTSAQHWGGDLDSTKVASTESGLRRGVDDSVSTAVVLSATTEQVLHAAAPLLAPEVLATHGAQVHHGLRLYRLIYSLHSSDSSTTIPS